METHIRTLLKTLTWRVVATTVVIIGVYYYSRDWTLALTSGIASGIVKTFLYYIHERAWANVYFGIDPEKIKRLKARKARKKAKHQA